MRLLGVIILAASAACSGPATPRDPTDHPPLLQIGSQGGPVLAAPSLFPVVWSGDETLGADMETFFGTLLVSDYWARLTEYGVGPGHANPAFVTTVAVPDAVDEKTLGKLVDAHAGIDWPSPDENGALILFPPTSLATPAACAVALGYHGESPFYRVPFAVVLRCPVVETVTETASHEAAEVATDPHPHGPRGYIVDGAEIADVCVGSPYLLDGNLVARLYSNQVAALGDQDPCGPNSDTRPFFNVAFDPGALAVHVDGQGNGSVLTNVEPFSYGDVGKIGWVMVANYGAPVDGVTISPSSGFTRAGETIAVTVSVAPGAPFKKMPLTVYATAQTTRQNVWYGSLTIDAAP